MDEFTTDGGGYETTVIESTFVATVTPTESVAVVTATVFPDATNTSASTGRKSGEGQRPALIGSIVGGAVAGVVIAVFGVFLWAWWGRFLERKRKEHQKETSEMLKTKANTRRNQALFSSHRSHMLLPYFHNSRPSTTVKFASVPHKDPGELDGQYNRPPALTSPPRETSHFDTNLQPPDLAYSDTTPPSPTVSQMIQFSAISPPAPFTNFPPSHPRRTLVNKPSDVSSLSLYSTQSADEQQERLLRSPKASVNFTRNSYRNSNYAVMDDSPTADHGHPRTSWYHAI